MKVGLNILIFLGLMFLFTVMWQIKGEQIVIEKVNIPLKGISPEIQNFRFVQISDIHFRHFQEKERQLLEQLKQIKPDYLFITGDLVDWSCRDLKSLESFLEELTKTVSKKTFVVLGNHEHKNPRFKQILKIYSSKTQVLRNKNFQLEKNLWIIGVDDPHLGFDDLKKAAEKVPPSAPKILLAHSPEIFRKVNFSNVLVLTGHTHGGQINIPLLVKLILPLKYDRQFQRGLFVQDDKWLYVNRGIGYTFLPIRFRSSPEITLFSFKP